jgi:hypothetical protein
MVWMNDCAFSLDFGTDSDEARGRARWQGVNSITEEIHKHLIPNPLL